VLFRSKYWSAILIVAALKDKSGEHWLRGIECSTALLFAESRA